MAKFCSQCGRPLEEGEVCTCQSQGSQPTVQQSTEQPFVQAQQPEQSQFTQSQQPFTQAQQPVQPQFAQQQYNGQGQQFNQTIGKATDATKALVGKLVPIVKSPVEELKNIAATKESKLGIQMILCNIVVSLLLLIISMVVVRVKLGDAAEYVSIPYAKTVILGTVFAAVYYFAMAGILFGFTKVFSKGTEVSFAQSITAVGGKALYDAAVFIISAICMIINVKFGCVILVIGCAFTYLLMVITYSESVELKGSFKVYVLAITYICMMIIAYLAAKVCLESMAETLLSGLSSSLLGGYKSGLY